MSETETVHLPCPAALAVGTKVSAWKYQVGTFLGGMSYWALRDEGTGVVYSSHKVFDPRADVRTLQPKTEVVESLRGEVVECTVLSRFEASASTVVVIRPEADTEGFR